MSNVVKKIILTGGSRGIGLETVRELLGRGHSVCATFNHTRPVIEHENLTWVQIDLSDQKQWSKLKKIISQSQFEVLINNAGMFKESAFKATDVEWINQWQEHLTVNLLSAVTFSKWILDKWIQNKIKGKLINVTSRAAYRGESIEFPAYGASKAALNNFTKTVARSFSRHGITAVNIVPGFVMTDMAITAIDQTGLKSLEDQTSTGKIAEPQDIAIVIADIIEHRSNQITGSSIHINGGSYFI